MIMIFVCLTVIAYHVHRCHVCCLFSQLITYRRKTTQKDKFAVSANISYGGVNRESNEGVVYEDLENVVVSVKRDSDQSEHQPAHDEEIPISQPAAVITNDHMDVGSAESKELREDGITSEDV